MGKQRILMRLAITLMIGGFLCATAGDAAAKYVKPDVMEIIKKIELSKDADKAAQPEEVAADYKEIMDRLITIAAEKYGIIFVVHNDQTDQKDFFSSNEG